MISIQATKVLERLDFLLKVGSYDVVQNRIPYHYFRTSGRGESDITDHAGSYHIALRNAGIEKCNIITYSSIIPAIAEEIGRPEEFYLGQELATIMACSTTDNYKRVTAGLGEAWLLDRESKKRMGGIVAEYKGNGSEDEAREQLKKSLDELYANGFSSDYYLDDKRITIESFEPTKRFGAAIVALCFTYFVVPSVKK